MKKSTLTDAERASQAHMAYPVSPITAVDGNTNNWISAGRPQELDNGLELYTLQKPGTKEVMFVIRGSDCIPNAAADWSPNSGANIAFAGSLHPQLQEAIRYINKFMEDHEGEGLIYSTTGHSKGGGFGQVIAHTFGFEGTALDPAPAGAVVESKEYLDFVHSLGIQPQGIPEHGFTNYVEKGSLVGDTLENLTIFGFGTGAHLGDTVRVNMAPDSWWWNSDIMEQHSTVDDTFSQATQGAAYVVGKALENALDERQQLLERQAQFQADQEGLDNTAYFVTVPELISIENDLKECDREIAKLTVIRLNKLQEEYGIVDNWMRQADFQVSDTSPQVIENLTRYYQNGIRDVVDGSLYLNSKELLSLQKDGKSLENKIAAMGGANAYENADTLPLESQLRQLNLRIHEIQEQQQELLQQKYGDQLDSWMRTDSFLEKAIPKQSSLDSLSSNDKAIIQNPDTLQKLLQEQAILQKGVQALTAFGPENSAQQQAVNTVGSGEAASFSSYVIQPGDTLSEIAKQHNTTVGDLLLYNPEIDDPDIIFTGDELIIPPEDWEYPVLQPIADADGNPVLLASTDGSIVEEILWESEESGKNDEVLDEDFAAEAQVDAEAQLEPATTFLGLDTELWKAMSKIAAAAQNVEQVGDDVTALIQAFQQGNDWDAFESTVNLLKSLDTVAGLSESYKALPGEISGTIQGMSSLVNAIGDLIRLEQALQDGDEWAIATSATAMIDNGITAYNHLNGTPGANGEVYSGAAASIVSLGLSVKQMADAFDDGDAIARMQATLSVVQSGLSTYVAVSQATAAMTETAVSAAAQTVGDALPAIGCAIGIAQGLLAIADGDIQGGTEQIGLAIATTILMSCGPYGWIGALVLQIGNATRNCDGQIIDTENIEEFTDNIAPAGDEAAHAAIVSIEKPAEWGNDIYEDNIYYSGFDVDMLAEVGVDIPEDLKPQFGFVKMNAEFFNPLRYTQYFEDLDEMSLSDIWDSLFISQSVLATIALFHKDEPPQASVSFTQSDDGQLAFNVGGDKSMWAAAESYGSAALKVMEYYQHTGGRLLIDGSLPNLGLVRGSGSTINYRSETGGQVSVMLDDMSQVLQEMSAVLYARDRGDRLDSAVDISRDSLGDIDFAKVDRIMAGYGFSKNGVTYTYGETKSLTGFSFGSGVFNGGGNVGPQGQHFVARDQDIKSLPLREDQRPSQTMGEIAKIVGLNNAFAGAGAELLAMAMISGGLLGLAANAWAAAGAEKANEDLVKPLDRFELEKYLQTPQAFERQEEEADSRSSKPLPTPAVTDAAQMQQFLAEHWGELSHHPGWLSGMPESAYFYRQSIGYHDLQSDGSRPGQYGPTPRQDDPLLRQRPASRGQSATEADGEVGDGHLPGQSFTGHRIFPDAPAAAQGAAPAAPLPPSGPVFVMAEDSALRFLLTELLEDTTPGSYGSSDNALIFVAFGQAANSLISREANGDIRFTPTPGFAGTTSFSYTVQNAAGDLIEKVATIQVENVNDTPLLQDDSVILAEGEPFYLDTLFANDTDPEGDTLTLDHLRGVSHGEIALLGGRLAFIPEAGYQGDVTFSYWVYDQAAAYPTMATATLTYLDQGTAPATGDDRFLVLEDTALTVTVDQLLVNDAEHDGENIAFAGLTGAAHGTVQEQPDGTILFTPEKDYAGTEAGFGYRVTDDSGKESTAWVAVEVLDAREAPVVVAATRPPLAEDEILTFTPDEVAGFVYDADGDQLHLDFITNVTGGTIVAAGGYYSFVPDPDYAGPASFDYRANDNHRGVVDGHLAFEILPVNDPIQIGQDILVTQEDHEVAVTVAQLVANDHDVDGATITFAGLGSSAHGSVALGQNDTIVFTPDSDYAGSDAGFEYTVQDDAGLESTGWVQVRVDNVNDAPAIIGNSLDLPEDQPLSFNAATLARFVWDADNDELRVTQMSAASGGTVVEMDSVYTFTPDRNLHGSGAIELTVEDGHGETATATLSVNILGSDDPATLGADFLMTAEEEGVSITVAALLANDHDEDGPLEFVRLGQASYGTAQLTALGEIHFTPDKDYFGNAAGFDYIVRDPDGNEAVGRVTVSVDNINDAPQIIGNSLAGREDEQITFNAATLSALLADPDGDAITLTAVDGVSGGTIEENGGIFTFVPDQEYHGPASLSYSADDGHGGQVSGQVKIELLTVDDPTDFGDDSFSIKEEQPLQVAIAELLANDSDGDGPLAFVGLGAAQHGEARFAGGTIEFIPEKDYFGNDAGFSYLVKDAEGHQATGRVTVAVEGVNDVPVIIADRLHLREDQTITFDQNEAAKFLFDGDGDLLHLDMVENVTGGRLSQVGGIYTFIPDADFYGEASFDYLATNSLGEELAGKLAIAIAPVNDLPKVAYASAIGIEDNEVTMTVAELMDGAADIEDGADLRFAGIDSSLHGAVYVDADEIVHFLPDKDFYGSGFFRYTVVDSEGGLGVGFAGFTLRFPPEIATSALPSMM